MNGSAGIDFNKLKQLSMNLNNDSQTIENDLKKLNSEFLNLECIIDDNDIKFLIQKLKSKISLISKYDMLFNNYSKVLNSVANEYENQELKISSTISRLISEPNIEKE